MTTARGTDASIRWSTPIATMMAAQSMLGLLLPGTYRDVEWIRATWFGNDAVTLLVAAPLLLTATRFERRGSRRGRLLRTGVLGYAVYNYAFYLLGAALNAFFLLYVVSLVASSAALADSLRRATAGTVSVLQPGRAHRLLGAYFIFVAAGLAAVWTAMWAAFVFAGRPTPVEPEAFRLVAALDLSLMVPTLVTGGVLLWRRHPLGDTVASLAGTQATLYLLVLSVNSLVAIRRGLTPAPGELPVWGPLLAATCAATWHLVASARNEVVSERSDTTRNEST